MRPDFERLAAFERERTRRSPPDLHRNLRVVEALYHEAVALGAWPPASLHDLEPTLRTARAFNVRAASRPDR